MAYCIPVSISLNNSANFVGKVSGTNVGSLPGLGHVNENGMFPHGLHTRDCSETCGRTTGENSGSSNRRKLAAACCRHSCELLCAAPRALLTLPSPPLLPATASTEERFNKTIKSLRNLFVTSANLQITPSRNLRSNMLWNHRGGGRARLRIRCS